MKKIISTSLIVVCVAVGVWYLLGIRTPAPRPPLTTATSTTSLTIVAFGDSLTAGYGIPLADAYPSQLERLLRSEGYDVTVVNAGVSGETSAGARERAQFVRNQQPAIVLLGIGGNDALRFLPVSEATANIRAVLTTLLSGNDPPKVILLGIQAPLNAGFAYKAGFDRMYPDLADEFAVPLAPFVVKGVTFNPDYTTSDGIHLNREGYRLIIDEYLAPAVRTELRSLKK
jgi:acyl-CoA thioesterase I